MRPSPPRSLLAALIVVVVAASSTGCATTAVEQQADIAGTAIGLGVTGAAATVVIAGGLGIAGAVHHRSAQPLIEPIVPALVGVGIGAVVAAAGIGAMCLIDDTLTAEVAPAGTPDADVVVAGAHQRAVGTGFVVAGATTLAATAATAGFVLAQQGRDGPFDDPYVVPAVALTGGAIGAVAIGTGAVLRATATPRTAAVDDIE